MSIPDLTNYIFQRDGGYWKITGPKRKSYGGYEAYPVIKCTKYGKEFQRANGFSAAYVEKLYNAGQLTLCVLKGDQVEVSTAGQESGIRKRRIQHLEGEVKTMLDELNKLLEREGVKVKYNLTRVDF